MTFINGPAIVSAMIGRSLRKRSKQSRSANKRRTCSTSTTQPQTSSHLVSPPQPPWRRRQPQQTCSRAHRATRSTTSSQYSGAPACPPPPRRRSRTPGSGACRSRRWRRRPPRRKRRVCSRPPRHPHHSRRRTTCWVCFSFLVVETAFCITRLLGIVALSYIASGADGAGMCQTLTLCMGASRLGAYLERWCMLADCAGLVWTGGMLYRFGCLSACLTKFRRVAKHLWDTAGDFRNSGCGRSSRLANPLRTC